MLGIRLYGDPVLTLKTWAAQYEIDHLDGKVFIEKLPLLARLRLKPELARLKKEWHKA